MVELKNTNNGCRCHQAGRLRKNVVQNYHRLLTYRECGDHERQKKISVGSTKKAGLFPPEKEGKVSTGAGKIEWLATALGSSRRPSQTPTEKIRAMVYRRENGGRKKKITERE